MGRDTTIYRCRASAGLVERIEAWSRARSLPGKSEAVCQLIRRGLAAAKHRASQRVMPATEGRSPLALISRSTCRPPCWRPWMRGGPLPHRGFAAPPPCAS